MYLQCLNRDDKIGLNYTYMGYAEYEFGATAVSRLAVARACLTETVDCLRCILKDAVWGDETEVVVFGDKAALAWFKTRLENNRLHIRNKGLLRVKDMDVVGWLSVRTDHPVILLRDQDIYIKRLEQFLPPVIEHLKEDAKNEPHPI